MIRNLLLFVLFALFASSSMAADKIKVMLLTGRAGKYHSWEGTSTAVLHHLNDAGIFEVDKVVAPAPGGDLRGFAPKWSDYDVIVLDYDGEEWSESAKASFVDYIEGGGGLVCVHASNNSFAYWPEFLRITGVGGWGGSSFYDPPLYPGDKSRAASRNETWGPRLYWQAGKTVRDDSKGGAGHPARHDFVMTVREPDHPITRGLPEMWLHGSDELYSNLRGPAEHVVILATGLADPRMGGASPYNEPLLFTVSYGKGRIFQTTLGHVGPKQDANTASVQNVDFLVTLQRGVEWAATGKVTQSIPDDFPNAYQTSIRPGPTQGWTNLLDPELSQWEVFQGVPHRSVKDLPDGTFQSDNVTRGEPIGLGRNLKGVFTTYEKGGETVLHVSGEIYGGLTSRNEFENFHLQTKMRWGEKKWEPRLKQRRDSGILYHCYGNHGSFWKVWKSSLEFQVQESDLGDLITLAGPKVQAPYRTEGKRSVYAPQNEFAPWTGYLHATVEPDMPHGAWNTLDIFVVGDSAIHMVNGKIVMSLKGAVDQKGQPLTRGQLQIQSEAAEVFYKDLKIRSLEKFPEILARKAKL